MLRIVIPASQELWDEKNECFLSGKEQVLQLEHSLLSVSKWESKWNKAFLGKKEKTTEETIDYIRCMTLTQNVDPSVYDRLTPENIKTIVDYIEAPMTATYFHNDKVMGRNLETVTSELIYYWMISLNIPFECQKWHLNRLFALIRVCSMKNSPPKKMSKGEIMRRNRALNEARKQQLRTRG